MNQPATKDDLKQATREIISHFNQSQGSQDARIKERFDKVDENIAELAEDVSKVKLAVIDLLATDRHLHNLVRELKAQGVKLDNAKIFASYIE